MEVTFTISDNANGTVKIVSSPSFETMISMIESGHEMTSAQGYALLALRTIKEESKRKEPTKILVPKLGRA